MLTHAQIWASIDALAAAKGMTASGLARKAGLDPTSFNPSKRTAPNGRPRWPTTESIALVLNATATPLNEFVTLSGAAQGARRPRAIPVLGLAQAGAGGYFDGDGHPTGEGWDEVVFPGDLDRDVYALEITGDSMTPLYRDGDTIIVSPGEKPRRGDRVVVKTTGGEITAKVLHRLTAKSVELHSLNPEHPPRHLPVADIEWMARIVWASQ